MRVSMNFVDPRTGKSLFGPFEWAAVYREGRAIIKDGDVYGAIDISGTMVIEPSFARLHSFQGGHAAAREVGGKMGYLDPSGTWVLEPKWSFTVGFTQGLGVVVEGGKIPAYAASFQVQPNGGKWGAVDGEGNLVIEPGFGHLKLSEGPVLVNKGGKSQGFGGVSGGAFWYLDADGAPHLGPFADAKPFEAGRAMVRRGKKDAWTLMDEEGEILATLALGETAALDDPRGGRTRVSLPGENKHGTKYQVVDQNGATLHEDLGHYDFIGQGVAIANRGGEAVAGPVRGGEWGWFDGDEFVTRPEWKGVLGYSDGVAVVSLGKKNGVRAVDGSGETLLDIDTDWARPTGGMLLVRTSD